MRNLLKIFQFRLIAASVASDEFDKGISKLGLQWQWNHNPDNQNWSLTQRPGFLRITTGRVDSNFEKRTDRAYFYYSLDGKSWTTIGNPLQMSYSLAHFVGYRFALFNYSTKTAGGFADFDYFCVNNKIDRE